MTALATPEDVAAALGREFTDAEGARVENLLDRASDLVRAYVKQAFTLGESTVVRSVRSGRVRLSQFPVVSVDEVRSLAGADVAFDWTGGPVVRGLSDRAVRVTYTHGYDEIPGPVVRVVAAVVARRLDDGDAEPNVTQESETVGPFTYSRTLAADAANVFLAGTEKLVLDGYAPPPVGSASVL